NLTALEFPAAPKKPHHHHHPANVQVHIGQGLGAVTAPNAAAATAVRAALSQLGVPYVWGGESPGHAFDCSGLTAWAYGRAGISLPHFASSQRIGKKVSEKDLAPGDLVIFSGHVTMYLGNGHVVAAPHTGTDVQIEPLFTSIPGDPFLGFYRPSVRT
ncbi:MAG TPA: C40 family peptidase, partial [Pseudonocardiaceae bacterium]|nr:C40 family peptidase [Pseudonocardiaceae bacterium]